MLVLALIGLLLSGTLLERMSRWSVFVKVDKLFILVPILLNLKGNLEMNLSLRMSTAANIGELDNGRTRRALVTGNLALLQVQSLIVAGAAGVLSFLLGYGREPANIPASLKFSTPTVATVHTTRRGFVHLPNRTPADPALALRGGYFELALVLAVSMLSASTTSGAQGAFLCALVIITRRFRGDPDNTAVPIAGSFGDLLTLTVLGIMASSFVLFEGTILATVILVALVLACIAFLISTLRNVYVRELVAFGWVPLFSAMLISSGAGVILDKYSEQYEGFSLLAPVVSGLPGASAAIFVSRISTVLHSGKLPERRTEYNLISGGDAEHIEPPAQQVPSTLLGRIRSLHIPLPVEGNLVPILLFTNTLLVQVLFLLILWSTRILSFGWVFVALYLVCSALSVALGLALAHCLSHLLWQLDFDPDSTCLPYATAIIDVISQVFQIAAFAAAKSLGDHVTTP